MTLQLTVSLPGLPPNPGSNRLKEGQRILLEEVVEVGVPKEEADVPHFCNDTLPHGKAGLTSIELKQL